MPTRGILEFDRTDFRPDGARKDLIEALDLVYKNETRRDAQQRVNAAMAAFYFLDQTRSDQNARFFSTVLSAERERHRLIEEERTRLHGIRYLEEIDSLRRLLGEQEHSKTEEWRSLNETLDQAVHRVEQLDLENNDLRAEIARLRMEIERQGADLNRIYGSKAWRAVSRARALKSLPRRWFAREASTDDQLPLVGAPIPEPWRPPIDSYPFLVSVIMPVYNKGATLRDSIHSVQSQTLGNLEIVLWDDGSLDPETQAVLDEVRTWDGVTLFESENQGVAAARNNAITMSRGRYICCLDPDDRIAPTYLETAVALLEAQPEYAITYPWVHTVGDKEEIWQTADLDPNLILEANHVPICAVFRREVFTATGGFSPAMSTGYEDWEFWVHAAELGFKGKAIPSTLFEYRFSAKPDQSRDAEARARHQELVDQIKLLHPNFAQTGATYQRSTPYEPRPVGLELGPRQLPGGEDRAIVLGLPWFTLGGADRVVEQLVTHWVSKGRTVVVFMTDSLAEGMPDRRSELQRITPYVYNLGEFLPRTHWYEFVSATLAALHDPVWLNIGSVWFYEMITRVREDFPTLRIVDQQFNPVGHVAANHANSDVFDLTVAAYSGLAADLEADGRSTPVLPIHVGIEQPPSPSESEVEQFREKVGAGSGDQVVLFLGRLSEEKRPSWALDLASDGPEHLRLVIVGDGPLRRHVEAAAKTNPHVIWFPHLDTAELAISASDVIVLPSTTEGIPLVALEALALQTPLVATRVGGLPDLADIPGVNLVDSDDPEAFKRAVLESLASPLRPEGLPDHFRTEAMLAGYDRALFEVAPVE